MLTKPVHAIELGSTLWGGTAAEDSGLTAGPMALISSILPNLYVIALIIVLVYGVVAGLARVISAGTAEQKAQGTQALTNALAGFLIIFASYWIIQLIQVITGVPILTGFSLP